MVTAKSVEAGVHRSTADYGVDDDHHSPHLETWPLSMSQEGPPTYSASSSSASKASKLLPVGNLPCVDFLSYRLRDEVISDDETTRTTMDPEMSQNVASLLKLLQTQAALPPKPIVRIRGTHIDYIYSWATTRTDFDLKLDITPLILPSAPTRSSFVNVRPITGTNGDSTPLRSWAQRFCEDPAEYKSFTLERLVNNWDTCYLERQIRAVIASTKYKGKVEITFPIINSRVVVCREPPDITANHNRSSNPLTKPNWRSSSKSSSENRAKTIKAFSHNEQMHSYAPIQVTWPYAANPSNIVSIFQPVFTSGSPNSLSSSVQSEQDWWTVWKEPIRNGVLAKKQGWVTVEDWNDVALGLVKLPEPRKSWGTSYDDWNMLMKGMMMVGPNRESCTNGFRIYT